MRKTEYDPTGVLIDGSIPRTEATRVADLLTDANTLMDNYADLHGLSRLRLPKTKIAGLWAKLYGLKTEARSYGEDWKFWHELEDEVIDFINEILPDEYICHLLPDDPGTILIEVRS